MNDRPRKDQEIPPLEWIAGVVGLLIVAGTLAFIGFETAREERQGPDLQTEVETINPGSGGYQVSVIVRNAGRTAASGVIIEGTSDDERGRDARVEAHLDYVPGLSEARATLVFPFRPDRGSMRVRIVGFTTP